MPHHSGFNRSKKSTRKDVARKASTVSNVSNSTVSVLKDPTESSRKETLQAQPRLWDSASGQDASKKPSALPSQGKKIHNVFEFLDEDEPEHSFLSRDDKDVGEPSSEASSPEIAPSIPAHARSERRLNTATISKGNGGPSRRHSVAPKNSTDSTSALAVRLPMKYQGLPMAGSFTPTDFPTESSTPTAKLPFDLALPETYYTSPQDNAPPLRQPLPPSPPKSPEGNSHRSHKRLRRNTKSTPVPSGYGLIASQLSSSSSEGETRLPPLYRRFETLNHRVLLYLQDEIAQMEEDLQMLDEREEMHRVAAAQHEGTETLPASRRMDVQAQVYSSLHYRRVDLMAALTHKTEQYNNALSAYSKVLQTLPLASEEDIESYRTWMKGKSPIAAAETSFLDHREDLVSLTARGTLHSTTTAPIYATIIIASTAILLPLLAFAMISEFSGRLVVVTVVGGAAAAIAANHSSGADHLVEFGDGWRCAAMYFGFMTVAAMFIP